ncbi:sensor histidine kinase [Nocardioides sp. SYSU DS0651]|uniref:sensor histidine kinase n=1 Tax=Nocardioides sp. SYSU DS0651 TaxID=3415955 RepID=UPI003F4C5B34
MRERLVLAFVGLTVAVIGLYGVPRAYVLADRVEHEQQSALDGIADTLAALADERRAAGGTVDEQLLGHGLVAADHVELTRPGGDVVTAGDPAAAPRGGLAETRVLDDGSTLRLSIADSTVSDSVREAITPLVVIGLVLAAAAGLLGFALARRLSRPFQDLAEAARSLGYGRFDIHVPPYSVPEAEAIGASLRGAAAQLDLLVRREREFAVNASHQLRTPITALRLGLEDLAMWPDTSSAAREELGRALGELDRLSAAIDELLDLARGRRLGEHTDLDLAALVAACVRRWERAVAELDRRVEVHAEGAVPARLPTGPVEQVLDVLLDNARLHGSGTITVHTRDAGTHLEVAVQDEGAAELGADVFHRGVSTRAAGELTSGIGLAVAAELAEVAGGHLSVDDSAPTTRFVLWLPRPDRAVSE